MAEDVQSVHDCGCCSCPEAGCACSRDCCGPTTTHGPWSGRIWPSRPASSSCYECTKTVLPPAASVNSPPGPKIRVIPSMCLAGGQASTHVKIVHVDAPFDSLEIHRVGRSRQRAIGR